MDTKQVGNRLDPKKKVTMKDIARYLDIDRTTVSKALASIPGVSEQMKERVNKAAEELGYRKDNFASGLTTGKNSLLGIVLADIVRGVFAPLITHFQQTAKSYNYGVILQYVNPHSDDLVQAIDLLKQQRVAGVTFVGGATEKKHDGLLIDLAESGVAVNTTRRDFIHNRIDSIRFDNKGAGRAATDYLLGLGHRNIAYLSKKAESGTEYERREGYLQAMYEAELKPTLVEIKDHAVIAPGEEVKVSYRRMKEAWKEGLRPSAVIGANDNYALGAMHALKEMGVPIPDEVSVVGFDDLHAVLAVPQMTSLRMPTGPSGAVAVRLLMERLKQPERLHSREVLEYDLIERESTGKARSAD